MEFVWGLDKTVVVVSCQMQLKTTATFCFLLHKLQFPNILSASSPLLSRQTERKCMWKRAAHLGRSLVAVFPLSLLSSWDATRCQSHTQTLTQDRRYRATFSYKFPMGEHQTPLVVWRSPPLFPCPLLLSPPLSPSLALSPLFIIYFHSFLPCIFLLHYSFTNHPIILTHKMCFPCYFIFFLSFFFLPF